MPEEAMSNPLQVATTSLTDHNQLFSFDVIRSSSNFCWGCACLIVVLTRRGEVRSELAMSFRGGWGSRLEVSLVFSPE